MKIQINQLSEVHVQDAGYIFAKKSMNFKNTKNKR